MRALSHLILFLVACSTADPESVCRDGTTIDVPKACAAWVADGPMNDVTRLETALVALRVWRSHFRDADDGGLLDDLLWQLARAGRIEAQAVNTPEAWEASAEAYAVCLIEVPDAMEPNDVPVVIDTFRRAGRLDELGGLLPE